MGGAKHRLELVAARPMGGVGSGHLARQPRVGRHRHPPADNPVDVDRGVLAGERGLQRVYGAHRCAPGITARTTAACCAAEAAMLASTRA
jgi:hypothetical protein